jgi:hypothetical protein
MISAFEAASWYNQRINKLAGDCVKGYKS